MRIVCGLLMVSFAAAAQVRLIADGKTDTYQLIDKALGGDVVETPDCAHKDFGPHVRQAPNTELGGFAFVFLIHVTPDNDRCVGFDRQRTEIKTYDHSPKYLKGMRGDSVNFRWRFRLDENFQPSANFTHIHQIKPGDGDADLPIITLTPRAAKPERLEVIHTDSKHKRTVLAATELAPFKGHWVEAAERIDYGTDAAGGTYSLTLSDVKSGRQLLSWHGEKLDMWRERMTFARPKWGIYRSLLKPESLRDEAVQFADFCLAKGTDDCK